MTAIAGSPGPNVEFYTRVLGLRLVKKTVNFDDPTTYHLYYGDGVGSPGTVLTFFPWSGAAPGRRGTGQVGTTAFVVPEGSLDYWRERLDGYGVGSADATTRFDERAVAVSDPDGLQLELVTDPAADETEPWTDGPVPSEHAVRGFHGVALAVEGYERTADLLETMGFEAAGEERGRFRHRSTAGIGSVVDVLCRPDGQPGDAGPGTAHHVAFRVTSEEKQLAWREHLADAGFNVTPVVDRQYFRSIYFREPGGVLFEIATDGPGFVADEDEAALGTDLRLPPWLEPRRGEIEAALPVIPTPRPERPDGR